MRINNLPDHVSNKNHCSLLATAISAVAKTLCSYRANVNLQVHWAGMRQKLLLAAIRGMHESCKLSTLTWIYLESLDTLLRGFSIHSPSAERHRGRTRGNNQRYFSVF